MSDFAQMKFKEAFPLWLASRRRIADSTRHDYSKHYKRAVPDRARIFTFASPSVLAISATAPGRFSTAMASLASPAPGCSCPPGLRLAAPLPCSRLDLRVAGAMETKDMLALFRR